jgi:hypothetical protein
MKRWATLTIGLLVFGLTAFSFSPDASGQAGSGWTTLFDGKNLGDWEQVGQANWRVEDGAIVADKLLQEKGSAHLVTKQKYKDFQIHVEFWVTGETNSGVFIRCQDPKSITATNCYEVNIWDARKDPSYGTGGVVNFAEVDPMPKAGGKWNTMEITAKGRQITVVLNGQKTADFRNGLFEEGPFTLQYGSSVVKFRKVAVKPL